MQLREFLAPKHLDIWKGWFAASLVLFAVMVATWLSGSDFLSLRPFWLAYVVPSGGMAAMSGAFLLRCSMECKRALKSRRS